MLKHAEYPLCYVQRVEDALGALKTEGEVTTVAVTKYSFDKRAQRPHLRLIKVRHRMQPLVHPRNQTYHGPVADQEHYRPSSVRCEEGTPSQIKLAARGSPTPCWICSALKLISHD